MNRRVVFVLGIVTASAAVIALHCSLALWFGSLIGFDDKVLSILLWSLIAMVLYPLTVLAIELVLDAWRWIIKGEVDFGECILEPMENAWHAIGKWLNYETKDEDALKDILKGLNKEFPGG